MSRQRKTKSTKSEAAAFVDEWEAGDITVEQIVERIIEGDALVTGFALAAEIKRRNIQKFFTAIEEYIDKHYSRVYQTHFYDESAKEMQIDDFVTDDLDAAIENCKHMESFEGQVWEEAQDNEGDFILAEEQTTYKRPAAVFLNYNFPSWRLTAYMFPDGVLNSDPIFENKLWKGWGTHEYLPNHAAQIKNNSANSRIQ